MDNIGLVVTAYKDNSHLNVQLYDDNTFHWNETLLW